MVQNHDLIVIGGSIGAVPALKALLPEVATDIPAAIFLAIHTAAKGPGLVSTVLSAAGRLPVSLAMEDAVFEHGHVYVAPPGRHLLIEDGKTRLGVGPKENMSRPAIDPLFRSAALSHGSRTIGVILSGYLNDGAAGLAAIKQCGGIALVQSPDDAEEAAMPLAAIETTNVDLCASAADLGRSLASYAKEKAGAVRPVPEDLKMEVAIARGNAREATLVPKFAAPSTLTCPDCGGVLAEIADGKPLRYRCQIGHAFTAATVLHANKSGVEEGLSVALRIIEERIGLISRMAEDAAALGRNGAAAPLEERAAEYKTYADTIRKAIRNIIMEKTGSE